MPEGAAKFIGILTGAVLIILGLGGIPLAVQADNMSKVALFTLCFFLGIGILGWAYKE